ncbi:TetR/AcrR family transcriptional regulator [Rhodococcus sp. JVH1]|uniref:TetR/AcrR family transcriptional regulator n=1 Tax=Rhodococcus sp. JVH1 TaxID=745408 RepID=UPI0002720881|nr:TetR/AcrR family transcriptional regulator [Rhodococcus sp. JVH1]EJI98307.1 transcriptional regulator, TetR family [Rhodococcus sp. JVH1]
MPSTDISVPYAQRGQLSVARINAATLELLRTKGPHRVTIEAVSERSGVAKTTIYRHYQDRAEMLRAALTVAVEETAPEIPSELPIRRQLLWMFDDTRRTVEEHAGRGMIAAVLTNQDPEFTELFREVTAAHRRTMIDVLEAAIEAGALPTGLDTDMTISTILGAYLAELLRHGTVEQTWAQRLLDTLWPGLASD